MFRFCDNCVWIGNSKFSQSRIQYLSWAVNVLTNTPNMWNFTKRDILQTNSSHSDKKKWYKCCHADLTSVWDPLTCWLSKEVLKRHFQESAPTKSSTVCSFRNTLAMTIFFFWKMIKIWWWFQKWEKNFRISFSFLI